MDLPTMNVVKYGRYLSDLSKPPWIVQRSLKDWDWTPPNLQRWRVLDLTRDVHNKQRATREIHFFAAGKFQRSFSVNISQIFLHAIILSVFPVFPSFYPLVNQRNYGKSPFLMGKLTINGHFPQLYMLKYQRVSVVSWVNPPVNSGFFVLGSLDFPGLPEVWQP